MVRILAIERMGKPAVEVDGSIANDLDSLRSALRVIADEKISSETAAGLGTFVMGLGEQSLAWKVSESNSIREVELLLELRSIRRLIEGVHSLVDAGEFGPAASQYRDMSAAFGILSAAGKGRVYDECERVRIMLEGCSRKIPSAVPGRNWPLLILIVIAACGLAAGAFFSSGNLGFLLSSGGITGNAVVLPGGADREGAIQPEMPGVTEPFLPQDQGSPDTTPGGKPQTLPDSGASRDSMPADDTSASLGGGGHHHKRVIPAIPLVELLQGVDLTYGYDIGKLVQLSRHGVYHDKTLLEDMDAIAQDPAPGMAPDLTSVTLVVQGDMVVGKPARAIVVESEFPGRYTYWRVSLDAPRMKEITLKRSTMAKEVLISSNSTIHYYDVAAETAVPLGLIEPHLFHEINGSFVDVTGDARYAVKLIDADTDGYPESVRWTVPMLSEQLFAVGEGANTGNIHISVLRSAPARVGSSTNFSVSLAVYNTGDFTAYNLTLNETTPAWTVGSAGGGTRIGTSINFTPRTLYPDDYFIVNYSIASNASGTGSFRWFISYDNISGSHSSINESVVSNVNIISGEPAYLFNLSPRSFNINNATLFGIGVKSIGSAAIDIGSTVTVMFPDAGWNISDYGGGSWNATNRSITYNISSSLAVGSTRFFNFTAALNHSAGDALTIMGSRSTTYLSQNYTDSLSPAWVITASGSYYGKPCSVTITNSSTLSYAFQNLSPTGALNARITNLNLNVLWDRNLTAGNTLVVDYDDVDVKNDNLLWVELFNRSDTSDNAGADFIAWDNNPITAAQAMSLTTHDYLFQFRVTASDTGTGNRNCGAAAILSVSQVRYRWNYTMQNWDSQDVFVRGYGTANLSFSSYQAPSSMRSSSMGQINMTLANLGDDTAVAINLTQVVTSQLCDVFTFSVNQTTPGSFQNYTYTPATKTISWSGLELQPNENVNLSFNITSPFCFSDELFSNALNATATYQDLKQNSLSTNQLKDITVNAGNRALLTHSVSPSEVTSDSETTMTLTLSSSGEQNVSSILSVNITIPANSALNLNSISDSGSYDPTTRTINWSNLGSLNIGETKALNFNITSNTTGLDMLTAQSVYQDTYGNRDRSDSLSVLTLQLTRSASFNPNPVAPSSSTTLTVSITNPYASSITSVVIVPSIPSGWSISPTSYTLSTLPGYGSTSGQFLVSPSDTSGAFAVNVSVNYTDPNSKRIALNTSSSLEISSRPRLVIVREMPPYLGTSQEMTVRFYVYNDGNAIAYNANLTENLDPNWRTSGSVTPLDGGTLAGNTTFWSLGNISVGNYSLARYRASCPSNAMYSFNSTARWKSVDGIINSTNEGPNRTIVQAGKAFAFDLYNRTNKIGQGDSLVFNATNIGTATVIQGAWPSIYIPTEWNVMSYGDGMWIASERILTYPESAVAPGSSFINNLIINTTTATYFVFKAYGQNISYMTASSGQLAGSPPNYAGSYTNTTADDTSYWWFGRLGQGSVNAYAEFTYNISSLAISRYLVTNLSFLIRYCHDGSTATSHVLCDSTAASGSPNGAQNVELYNYTLGQWQDIGDLRTSDGGGEVTDLYGVTGDAHDFISATNLISVRYQMNYLNSNVGGGQNSFIVLDYAPLNVTYIERSVYQQNLFVLAVAGTANVTIVSPSNYQVVYQGDPFNVTANITAKAGNIYNSQAQILISSLLSLPDSDATHSTGDLLENLYTNTTWNVSANTIGLADITVKTSAASGTSTQHQIFVDVSKAISIQSVVPAQTELEPGDTLTHINVTIRNLARSTHNITTGIDIYNSSSDDQQFGPLDSESITNISITTNQNAFASFSNQSLGYPIPLTTPLGNYTVRATSTPDALDADSLDGSLLILGVLLNASVNASQLMPGGSVRYNVSIGNGWGSVVNYNVSRVNVTYQDGSDVTVSWGFNPLPPLNKTLGARSNGSISFNVSSPANYLVARAGNYSLNATITFTDPNGRAKSRSVSVLVEIAAALNYSVRIDAPATMPLSLTKGVNVTVTNLGNTYLSGVNVTIGAENGSGAPMAWDVVPATGYLNASFNHSNQTQFNLTVPASAAPGTYTIRAYANQSTLSVMNVTSVLVTQDIMVRAVAVTRAEYEAGDVISEINASINNTGDEAYTVNSSVDILNSSGISQVFGPLASEVNSSPFAAHGSAVVRWTNASAGYPISAGARPGPYSVRVNTTWAGGVKRENYTSFSIVAVNVATSLNATSVGIGRSVALNVSVLNNFSSGLGFNISAEVWDLSGNNDTSYWGIAPGFAGLNTGAAGSNSTKIIISSPMQPVLAEAGLYSVQTRVRYQDPNGVIKTRQLFDRLTVQPYINLSAVMNVPDMPKEVSSQVLIVLNNTGNANISSANVSLRIYRSDGSLMGWSILPSENQTSSVAFGATAAVGFTVIVPGSAAVGNYSANASIDFDGTEGESFNLSAVFEVTEDISVMVNRSQLYLEPGDRLDWIEANISNINQVESYNVSSWMEVFNPGLVLQGWGPNSQDVRNTTNLGPGAFQIVRWNNSLAGYTVASDAGVGSYVLKATGNLTSLNTLRYGYASLNVILVSAVSNAVPQQVGIGDNTTLSITISNSFPEWISFNLSQATVRNSTGAVVTSLWNISPQNYTLNVMGFGSNVTMITVVSPGSFLLALPDNYSVNYTYSYVDTNGRAKSRTVAAVVELVPDVVLNLDIIPSDSAPPGLDSVFTLNISNAGNTLVSNANVSVYVSNLGWNATPSTRLINVSFNSFNASVFNVSVPWDAQEGVYLINATAIAGGQYFYDNDSFLVARNIFVRRVMANITEAEPGTLLGVNVTVENTHPSRAINVTTNVSILNGFNLSSGWNMVANVSLLQAASSMTARFNTSISPSAGTGNYTLWGNATYAGLVTASNTSMLTVSTIAANATAGVLNVNWNQSATINVSANSSWFSRGFNLTISIIGIVNQSGAGSFSSWNLLNISVNRSVAARGFATALFVVNTSNATRGRHNFTIEMNYTDPNTGGVVRKLVNISIGVGIAQLNGYYQLPDVVATEELYIVNATVANVGGVDLARPNISLYLENGTKQWWITPRTYQLPDLNVTRSNTTAARLVIPRDVGGGWYNATIQVNYTDQDGAAQIGYFRQQLWVFRGIDINILVNGYEYALVTPGQTVTVTTQVLDAKDLPVSGANVSLDLYSFDGRSTRQTGLTDAAGNFSFSFALNLSRGGYYATANVTTPSFENESREVVVVGDDSKRVLVVADDDVTGYGSKTNDAEISNALSTMGSLSVSVTRWFTSVNGSPSAANMSGYDAVMWSLGDHMLTGVFNSSAEVDSILGYLSGGGGLFLESGGLAYNVYQGSYSTDSRILTRAIRAAGPVANPQISGAYTFDMAPEYYTHPLIDGLGGELDKNSTVSKLYKDKVWPNASLGAVGITTWRDLNESSGIAFDERSDFGSNGSKSVYYSFPIDGIQASEMNKLVKNAFAWLASTYMWVYVQPNATLLNIYSETSSDEAMIKVYVRDHDSQLVTNLASGSSINATLVYPNGSIRNISLTEQNGFYKGYANFTKAGIYRVVANVSRIGNVPSAGFVELAVTENGLPTIALAGPANNSVNASNTITFYYNASDALSGIWSCSLLVDGALNATNGTVQKGAIQNFTVMGLSDGAHSWQMNCSDDSPDHNSNVSSVRQITIDTVDPLVTLILPGDDSWDTDGLVQMGYRVVDDRPQACQLWGNFSGGFALNQTDASPVNNTNRTFGQIMLADGGYSWNVRCNDSSGRSSFAQNNYTVKVGTHPPLINLARPYNNSEWNLSAEVVFEYNVSSLMTGISNCSLSINGALNGSVNSSISEGMTQTFTRILSYNRTYLWNINCTDNNGLANASLTYNFSVVDRTSPSVTLLGPRDGDNDPDGNVTFQYVATDNFGLRNCSLFTNMSGWGMAASNISVENGTVSGFSLTNIAQNTTFIWNVRCLDLDNNLAWGAQNWSVRIGPPTLIPMNITIPARISVTDSPPQVVSVTMPAHITLAAGSQTSVVCNATVFDLNGYMDIKSANATLYDSLEGSFGGTLNGTNHYENTSCSQVSGNGFYRSYSCSFDLWYFANNGSWACNVTALDQYGLGDRSGNLSIVDPLFAIDVTPYIDYGALNIGQASASDEVVEVTNLGNVMTDLAVRGYANSDGDGMAMNCSRFGNISMQFERYSLSSGQGFAQMTYNLTSYFVNVTDFDLPKQIDINVNSSKQVYWKLQAPPATYGSCRGTVILSAFG